LAAASWHFAQCFCTNAATSPGAARVATGTAVTIAPAASNHEADRFMVPTIVDGLPFVKRAGNSVFMMPLFRSRFH
jgi:hypothetical protein